jgi:zinc protease
MKKHSTATARRPDSTPEGFEFKRRVGDIDEYILTKNGLRVLVREDHATPLLGIMVTYHVGSRNETIGYTGATHFLEHLLFKGSDNFNEKKGNKLEIVLGEKGALLNATTWFDRTNYYAVIASEHAELAIAAEADRMRRAWLTEEYRKTEITIVRSEFERNENKPMDPVIKQLFALAYQAHPYHHDTIGWRSDIENVPIERLQWFYDQYYWPNNATVTVVGDIETPAALSLVRKHFGQHEKAPHPFVEPYTTEPPQEGERRAIVKRAATQNMLAVAYKIPEGLHADTPVLDIVSALLTDGKSSRLHKLFIEKNVATDVTAYNFVLKDPSLLTIFITLSPKAKHLDVERLLSKELHMLATKGPTTAELKRVKQRVEAAHATRRDGHYATLSALNEWIALGDWSLFETHIEAIRKVSIADVKRVLNNYIQQDQSTVCHFIGTATKQ